MKIKRMVKRLFAVGTGVAMIGATAMGAMGAADLKEYPSQFVTDGTFNGYFVVGEKASALDNLAMTDIAGSMKYVKSAASSKTVAVSGDAWRVGTTSQQFELANNNATDSNIVGENINSISNFISKNELQALADGSFSTNANTYAYKQYLFFDSANRQNAIVKFSRSADTEATADHFYLNSNGGIARYEVEFTSSAQSRVTNSDGAATSSGTYLKDFEGKTIKMLGKEYTIVQARRSGTNPQNSIKLVLMSGTTGDTLLEGETKTYTVGGKEYEVSMTYVDTTNAKFTVNGEQTSKLQQGDTFVLKDKTELGVSEVLYQNYAGGIHSSSFYIGAKKMELEDTGITDTASSTNLKVGSETVDGTGVVFTGSDDNTTFSLRTIQVNMTASDNFWVPAGGKLSSVIKAAGEDEDVLLAGALDFEYKGLEEQKTHDIGLKSSSQRRYNLHVYDADNNAVDIPVAYEEGQYNLTQGAESVSNSVGTRKTLVMAENLNVSRNDYFVLSANAASQSASGSAKSFLLQYRGADANTKSNPKIKFKNEGSGELLEYSVGTSATIATIQLGGYSFAVRNATVMTADDFSVSVDLDASGAVGSNRVNFVDSYGSEWAVTAVTGVGNESAYENSLNITQTTPNLNDFDNWVPTGVLLKVTAGSSNTLAATDLSALTYLTPEGVTDRSYAYTSMGTYITYNNPTSDPETYTLAYPEDQRLPMLYVTSGATTTTSTVAGDLALVTVVDATKLDSEVADVSAQNLIVVGGPCVNSVAAELLGNPADCTEGFTPGKARVKLFENGGKVAMLVAGYSGADTRLAGKVVAHRGSELTGSEVEIEGTTYSDATISAPTAKVVVAKTE